MASNRNDFDDFLDEDDDTAHRADTRAEGRLLRIPLTRISPNLVNPRSDFGTEEELEDFGRSLKRRQIQAVPVVTRSAYLDLWPDHKEQIGNVDVVIVSGERRYRAATAVQLPALECVVNDNLAESRKTFLNAVVSENIDRQNFDPVEEAHAVQALVDVFGTARAVAEHYERGDGWVSQRRVLLELAPGAQELVRRRGMPLEYARKLGKLTKDHAWTEAEQLKWWEQEDARRKAATEERKATRGPSGRQAAANSQPGESRESFTAVKHPSGAAPVLTEVKTEQATATPGGTPPHVPAQAAGVFTAVKTEPDAGAAGPTHDAVMGAAHGSEEAATGQEASSPLAEADPTAAAKRAVRMPWEDGRTIARFAIHRMTPEELDKLRDRLIEHSPMGAGQAGAVPASNDLPWDDEVALGKMLLERVDREKIPALIDALMEGR